VESVNITGLFGRKGVAPTGRPGIRWRVVAHRVVARVARVVGFRSHP